MGSVGGEGQGGGDTAIVPPEELLALHLQGRHQDVREHIKGIISAFLGTGAGTGTGLCRLTILAFIRNVVLPKVSQEKKVIEDIDGWLGESRVCYFLLQHQIRWDNSYKALHTMTNIGDTSTCLCLKSARGV